MTPTPEAKGRPARILIVDDELHNRRLLEVMLAPEGYQLLTASNGDEALALVARQPPDLILLDFMMPGMDGSQVARNLKATSDTKSIPIIMVTALDHRDARIQGLSAGAEDFLTKPVDRAELCVRVRNLLRLKAYGDHYDNYSQILEVQVASRTADLAESERLYRSTFDAAPVGIVHMRLDGRWLRVNQRLCDLLGYSREDLQSIGGRDLSQSEEAAGEADALRRMAAGALDRHVIEEKRFRRRDGGVLWGRVNISVHRDDQGQPQHFISVVEDITQRRMLEAQIRQANKMDAIGRLASGVAHDFNNLLTVILGFAGLVVVDPAVAERHGEEMAEIIKAAERASGLTRQLLAFSRLQVLQTAPLDVNGLITDMTGMLGRLIGENIEISRALAPDLSLALADRSQVEQVVMNLVVNARDAMPDGGTVTIETKEVDLENSSFHEQEITKGRYVMLAVTDTGKGMTRETQRRLFEPFFTTKETGKGSGLGLSTAYGIVKQSRGYIWVYSEPDRGTTFKVYLPRSNGATPVPAPIPVADVRLAGVGETVLLVEDEAAVRRLAKRVLGNAGFRVLEAANGHDAERVFASHADTIGLIVTDMIMPGCGGPELLRRLHVKTPDLRVLYMSGYTDQSSIESTGIDRGSPFVQKPFTAEELVRQVRQALDR